MPKVFGSNSTLVQLLPALYEQDSNDVHVRLTRGAWLYRGANSRPCPSEYSLSTVAEQQEAGHRGAAVRLGPLGCARQGVVGRPGPEEHGPVQIAPNRLSFELQSATGGKDVGVACVCCRKGADLAHSRRSAIG